MYERLIIKDLDCITYITSNPTTSLNEIKEIYKDLCRYLITTNSSVVIYKGFIVSEIRRFYYTDKKDFESYKKYIRKIVYYRNKYNYKLPSINTILTPKSMTPLLRFMSQWVYNREWFSRFYGDKVNAEMSPVVKYSYKYLSTALYTEEMSDEFFNSLPFEFDKCFYMFMNYYKYNVEKAKSNMGMSNTLLTSNMF